MPGHIELGLSLGPGPGDPRRRPANGPRRLLIVGDFAGTSPRAALADRPTHAVDLDRLDAVLARIAPSGVLRGGERLGFSDLDDFHPDALWRRLPLFASLREARARGPGPLPAPAPAPPGAPPPSAAPGGGDLLGSLLGGRPAAAATPMPPAAAASGSPEAAVDALIRRAMAGQAVPDRRAETAAWNRAVDLAATEQMRALLHEPAFQALEAGWRGVLSLLQHIEQDGTIEVHLFDLGPAEALADLLAAQGDARRGGLHQALVGRWKGVPGAAGWDAIVGLQRFGPGPVDMALLAAWSLIAESAGCPFVADADPVLAADPADPGLAAWMALRRSPSARWVGLVTPRLLLRQPYGARRDPVTAFAFEELDPGAPPASALLWGAGALGWARLWAQSQAADPDADATALAVRTLDDLPAVTYEAADGERELVPVAELFQAEEALAKLAEAGLMPLASHRHEAVATLVLVRSVAGS
jgi:type VI secretion system protein ImpC